ncbi:MAG: aminoglycoside phosphotransferase family protein [Clostridia bacterium]|nr:aminoglycoside phosphotransferase family protein [Clostridia bacterium]
MDFTTEFKDILSKFKLPAEPVSTEPFGAGHINRTFLVTTKKGRFILQKINTEVFRDPDGLMKNYAAVTDYLAAHGAETVRLVPTKTGETYLKGESCYRLLHFIENTVTYQIAEDAETFRKVGFAFGDFQNRLADFPADTLTETIPHFHDTPKRFRDFLDALGKDTVQRAATCRKEIDFVLSHKNTYSTIADALADGSLPVRVTHNDTKLNNILLDEKTKDPRAVIDLDTVMPGTMLYDFGDSIRFGASTAAEDEQDLSRVHFDLSLFAAYAKGFLSAVKKTITPKEAELLPVGAYMMTVECGMRFLTDYLSGDTYFATKYPEHNLIRARTQFALAEEMERSFELMSRQITEILK